MAFSKNPLSRSINVNTTNTTSRSGTVASYNSEMNPATAAAEIEMEHRKQQHAPPQSATAAASSLQSSSVPTSPLQIPLHYQFEGPGDGDGDGGKTAMETYRGIWYTRTRLEEQFLVKSFLETRFRYLILEAITLVALVGLISTATNPGVVAFLTASMVYSPIAIIADASLRSGSQSASYSPVCTKSSASFLFSTWSRSMDCTFVRAPKFAYLQSITTPTLSTTKTARNCICGRCSSC